MENIRLTLNPHVTRHPQDTFILDGHIAQGQPLLSHSMFGTFPDGRLILPPPHTGKHIVLTNGKKNAMLRKVWNKTLAPSVSAEQASERASASETGLMCSELTVLHSACPRPFMPLFAQPFSQLLPMSIFSPPEFFDGPPTAPRRPRSHPKCRSQRYRLQPAQQPFRFLRRTAEVLLLSSYRHLVWKASSYLQRRRQDGILVPGILQTR